MHATLSPNNGRTNNSIVSIVNTKNKQMECISQNQYSLIKFALLSKVINLLFQLSFFSAGYQEPSHVCIGVPVTGEKNPSIIVHASMLNPCIKYQ